MFYKIIGIVMVLVTVVFLSNCSSTEEDSNKVVYKEYKISNVEALDTFIEDAENHKEAEITVVRFFSGTHQFLPIFKDSITYTLKTGYYKKTDESWIDVQVVNHLKDLDTRHLLKYNQQCSSITKNPGEYTLNECHQGWSFPLIPTEEGALYDKEKDKVRNPGYK
ncbi:hypothetical protein [Bacillus sp. 1P06AnD]|uniref:hypothetical protein n=1 Tax=Bacillus sp. 1P06AnD TaxID=3132208 RepID=UPI0039A31DC6